MPTRAFYRYFIFAWFILGTIERAVAGIPADMATQASLLAAFGFADRFGSYTFAGMAETHAGMATRFERLPTHDSTKRDDLARARDV